MPDELVALVIGILSTILTGLGLTPLILRYVEKRRRCNRARTRLSADEILAHEIKSEKALEAFEKLMGTWHDPYLRTYRDEEALEILKRHHRLLIIGRDGLGKTRLALEITRKLVRERGGELLILWPDPTNNECPPVRGRGALVLLLDDLDEFVGKVMVSEVIRLYEHARGHESVYVIATCRLRGLPEMEKQRSLVSLFPEEVRYRPPDFSLEEGEAMARELGRPFDREAFDGTASSVVGEPRLRNAYRGLDEEAKSLLKTIKLLFRAGIRHPKKGLAEKAWREVFGMRAANFESVYRRLEDMGFFKTEMIYKFKVIKLPYPSTLNRVVDYEPGLDELKRLARIVVSEHRACNEALTVGVALLRAGEIDEALRCFDYIIEETGVKGCDELIEEAYYNKAVALFMAGRRLEALASFAEAFKRRPSLAYEYFDIPGALRKLEEMWDEARRPEERAGVALKALKYIAIMERHIKKYSDRLRISEEDKAIWARRAATYLNHLGPEERKKLAYLLDTIS